MALDADKRKVTELRSQHDAHNLQIQQMEKDSRAQTAKLVRYNKTISIFYKLRKIIFIHYLLHRFTITVIHSKNVFCKVASLIADFLDMISFHYCINECKYLI